MCSFRSAAVSLSYELISYTFSLLVQRSEDFVVTPSGYNVNVIHK